MSTSAPAPDATPSLLPPPDAAFGHALRGLWLLDPAVRFLNHGSFGATPRYVLAAQTAWRERLERQPVRFMADELPAALAAAATRLAGFLGADAAGLVFVDNATAGVNAILNSLAWRPGERLVIANHGYKGVKNAAGHCAHRHGLELVEAPIPWPLHSAQQIIDAFDQVLRPGTRLAIIDQIFSALAVVAPLTELIALCRQRGIAVLVDGAHGPGMLPLALDALGADWYVGNCHKWLCAAKGCGFLYASADRRADLHPPVISNFYGEGLAREFAWPGTIDPTARLSVTAALDFLAALGVNRYQAELRRLAAAASQRLAATWGVEAGAPPELFAAMVTLPLPITATADESEAARQRRRLLDQHGIEVPVLPIGDRLWVRISAQVYNELDDYLALGRAWQ